MRSFSCFKPRDPFRNWSKELDKRVAIWARNFDSSFKLLLLGPAGAGKTTIMKQMKIIHFEGFSIEERQQKAKEIRSNLLESVRELTACITASGHQISWCDGENQNRLEFINGLNLDDQTYDVYAAKIYDYSKRILTDKGVEELFAKLNQLSITHRSQYLLNRVDEIRNVNYIPNNDDILQSRRKTSDIQKLEFHVKLPVKSGPSIQQTFCMFDVGGQRGERRKWIQVFDGVSAVMFLIDSSSFDAIDDENGRNKLKETINLFYEVWTTRFLLNSNFVLLFNKQDILREKIERGHKIEDHFPEFKLYKFQQTSDRHHAHRSKGAAAAAAGDRPEKLSLFRMSSSRTSTRSTSSRTAGSSANPTSAAATPATKRKSASMYLFGTSSASSGKALRSPDDTAASRSVPSAPTQKPLPRQQPAAGNSRKSEFHDASKHENSHYLQQQDQNRPQNDSNQSASQQQQQHEQDMANHIAYLKARSFIRDKFLQVTRQAQHNLPEQRKFSSPNLPVYNKTPGGNSASARLADTLPKRNVCYHYTTATDTENIRDLFENLQKMVLKSTMKDLM